jgi:hypothetical protein
MNKLQKEILPFGMVPNKLLNNKFISLKAKGLFAYMQSKPNGWNFSARLIATQSKESIDAISAGLQELEKFGFLNRKKTQTSKGFSTTYKLVFDAKLILKPITENPTLENPMLENPMLENPMLGKSLNISKKDISNKDISNKEERESALAFFESNYPIRFQTFQMQFKKQINDYEKFCQIFEANVMQEKLVYDGDVLEGRLRKLAINWVSNQNKFDGVIDLNANIKKEKIGGF